MRIRGFVYENTQFVEAKAINEAYERKLTIKWNIEAKYPDARATWLSNGKWLLTSRSPGIAVGEIA